MGHPATAPRHDHQLPTEGPALTATAISATMHCLTGCAIGEIAGMAIGTALGLSSLVTVALAVALAFAFGYGLTSLLFWGSLSFALAVAAVVTVPVNRYLIARGRGHAAVHRTGVHGGPPARAVAAATVLAFLFGGVVLVAEALV